MAPAEEETSHDVVVEADELPSAYGAPPDLSRGRISTLTKSYVLPPFSFELESIYEGDVFRDGSSQHLFTQEIEMGLPWRLTIGLDNQLTEFDGGGGERAFGLEARYALANWNKIPLNPALAVEYKFGIGQNPGRKDVGDSIEAGLLLSHDFRHMIEWAMNVFVDQEVRSAQSTSWGFAQSAEIPILLPDEQLEVGVEMQYRHADGGEGDRARGFVIGPTLAWRPTKSARVDVSPLIGCTGEAPRLQVFAVFSYSFGGPEKGETEIPASARNH